MIRTVKRGLGVMVAALALVTFTAQASEHEKASKEIGKSAVKKLEYVNDVALFNQGQIELAKLAQEKSQNPEVKQFAQKLQQTHEQQLSDLRSWAQSRGFEVAQVYLSSEESAVGGSGLSDKTKEMLGEDAQKASERIDKKTNEMRGEIDQLREKSGPEFDKAFLSRITDDQKKGQDLVKKGVKEYKGDVGFAMLLNKTQPVLKSQEESAKSIEKNLKG